MSDTKPRFAKGKLVMLSRKNTRSGNIPYFDVDTVKDSRGQYGGYQYTGHLERGVPVLLTANPEFLDRKEIKDLPWHLSRHRDNHLWKITFLKEEKLYFMYLSNRQYNHELVKAVPRRLTKDYTRGNSEIRS